ncbi:Xaa-Pro peptidase family protein [Undibacterium sp. TS12]|uniref:M24 family metallopeptidase n=1 Tax=Undibacterium sp. TS12 TaxID=2908202 RepID=UPI001F4C80ED|nr:Xaa-Pro peptidase family protein [Undibacterium sp. TS12]MCH8617985.1 Xaa-Pro peptidase family protein [Undibacterium sp. TS12]
MKAQYEQRLAKLRQQMITDGHDCLLVFSLDNLRYLANYSGEAACGLITAEHVYLITDYRFVEQALEECINSQVICRNRDRQSLGQAIRQLLEQEHITTCAFETAHISVQAWAAIQLDLPAINCPACVGLVEELRKIKDDWEISQISMAAAIADQALRDSLPLLTIGVTERDFAVELEYRMQKLGAEALSFPSIVGFGARSALPHCIPSNLSLRHGDLVVIDFGAVINGYRSDMTRSFVAGKPNAKQTAIYRTVQRAQQAAFEQLRAGQAAVDVSSAAAAIIRDSEFAAFTSTGLGHGVGLQLHEPPFISPVCQDILQRNYVVTIEPGIYIPGYGGIRIEDDVVITGDGYCFLTHAPKDFELAV